GFLPPGVLAPGVLAPGVLAEGEVAMHRDGGRAGGREIMMVLALALTGLLLAGLAAFTPWYGRAGDTGETHVVEMRAPGLPASAG
ncbi:MAG TPA: hypothetical protein VFI47_08465, partial [Acidimicrobiales bacterium]|nr:hypothetical protein [Acidimicrobiales bacterium]